MKNFFIVIFVACYVLCSRVSTWALMNRPFTNGTVPPVGGGDGQMESVSTWALDLILVSMETAEQ